MSRQLDMQYKHRHLWWVQRKGMYINDVRRGGSIPSQNRTSFEHVQNDRMCQSVIVYSRAVSIGKNIQYCLFLPVRKNKLQNWGDFVKVLFKYCLIDAPYSSRHFKIQMWFHKEFRPIVRFQRKHSWHSLFWRLISICLTSQKTTL